MTIGEALKKERQALGLTQTEMAGSILSKSFYSKVERNQHDIKAIDLINILRLHNIDLPKFFKLVGTTLRPEKNDRQRYLLELHEAFYHKDIKKIDKIEKELKSAKQTSEIVNLTAQAIIIKAYLTHRLDKLSNNEKIYVKKQIFKTTDWNENTLRLLAISLPLFKSDELKIIVNGIFSNNFHNINSLPATEQDLISAIAVNYLELSYQRKEEDMKEANLALSLLRQLDSYPENCYAKIMAHYYQALFNHNQQRANQIKRFLSENGMSRLVIK